MAYGHIDSVIDFVIIISSRDCMPSCCKSIFFSNKKIWHPLFVRHYLCLCCCISQEIQRELSLHAVISLLMMMLQMQESWHQASDHCFILNKGHKKKVLSEILADSVSFINESCTLLSLSIIERGYRDYDSLKSRMNDSFTCVLFIDHAQP